MSHDDMIKPGMAFGKSTCEPLTGIARDHLVMPRRENVQSSGHLCTMLMQKFDTIEACSLVAFDDVQTRGIRLPRRRRYQWS